MKSIMMRLNLKDQLKAIALLRATKKIIVKMLKKIARAVNGMGDKKKCYVCGNTFYSFTKFRGGFKNAPPFGKKLNTIGSDIDNFGCIYCNSHDRERHLFMFFDKLMLWERMLNGRILHFAPEKNLQLKISRLSPLEYVKADICPKKHDIQKIDATAIPFSDDMFDFIIANHILEHIPDYYKALYEFYRVLKPGGIAILQTPYSRLLKKNFEDKGIDSDELRLFFHGQEDHVRTFGEHQFLKSLEEVGFRLKIKKHADYFDAKDSFYYGVNIKEDLIMVEKTKS